MTPAEGSAVAEVREVSEDTTPSVFLAEFESETLGTEAPADDMNACFFVQRIGEVQTLAAGRGASLQSVMYRFTKRLFDFVFSAIALALLLVPGLVLCAAIMIESPGVPIYRQKRVGQYGKEISVLKFRTMYSDADSNPQDYFTPEQFRQWKTEFKVQDDPRITRIGHLLRATSLDEVPQFINVLCGQMSVVGCRPVTAEEVEYFEEDKDKYLSIKPGITGWWQVTARNNATYDNGLRQRLEIYYVDNRSIVLDSLIVFRTAVSMFCKTGQ